MKKLKCLLLVVLSSGWLLPACISLKLYGEYLQHSVIPEISGRGHVANFPLLSASYWMFVVAACWLGSAIGYWVIYVVHSMSWVRGIGAK